MSSMSPRAEKPPITFWSIRIATISGIPIRLHTTFLLFILWEIWANRAGDVTISLLFAFAISVCILLHELAHALVARHYGYATSEITLSPIGGYTLTDGRPTPKQELLISGAGPLVNAILAGFFFFVMIFTRQVSGDFRLSSENFWQMLCFANVIMAVFNMMPVFPLDGGRMLRALLAMFIPIHTATKITTGTGQVLSVVLGIVGLVIGAPILCVIAFFLFLGASRELANSTLLSLLHGKTVGDAMSRQYLWLAHGQTAQSAADMMSQTPQDDYPVVVGHDVVGIVSSAAIQSAVNTGDKDAYLATLMTRNYLQLTPDVDLTVAAEEMGVAQAPALVYEGDNLVGTLSNLSLQRFIDFQAGAAKKR